ncbi:hypothetical protein ACJX0J_019352 [Zea mays]
MILDSIHMKDDISELLPYFILLSFRLIFKGFKINMICSKNIYQSNINFFLSK